MSLLVKNSEKSIKPAAYNNIIDRFFRDSFSDFWNGNFTETVPAVNIVEHKENFNIEMAAPGMKKEDFKIEMDGDVMTISCEKETDTKEEKKDFWKREYNYSSFSRSFTMPVAANTEKIAATYKDGILSLNVPKKAEAVKYTTRKISVN